jgi:hypothetical protein
MSPKFQRLAGPLRLLVGLLIFTLLIYHLDWHALSNVLLTIDVRPLALSMAMSFPFLILKGWRWYLLLTLQNAQYKFGAVVLDFLCGNYIGLITPGRVGELSRVIYQKQASGISYGQALSNVLVDRFLDLGVTLVVAIFGFIIYRPALPAKVVVSIIILLLTGVALVGAWKALHHKQLRFQIQAFAFKGILSKYYARLPEETSGIQSFWTNFCAGLNQFMHWKIIFPVLVSLLAFSFMVWQNSFLVQSIHVNLPIPYLAFCITVINLVSLIPISISGIGTRDAMFVLLLAEIGVSLEQALSLSLLFLFTFNVTGILLGALAWCLRPTVTKSYSETVHKSSR